MHFARAMLPRIARDTTGRSVAPESSADPCQKSIDNTVFLAVTRTVLSNGNESISGIPLEIGFLRDRQMFAICAFADRIPQCLASCFRVFQ